ncbi:MAG: LysM peptidoglycan-binding domain-containing protein [Verrucomicrobiota bacterium]
MTATRLLTPSLLALALASCASHPAREYDTLTAAGPPAVALVKPPAPSNPVYDTPAAYEEGAATTPAPAPALAGALAAAPAPAASSNGAAIIHTVVKGDTLSGISKKYRIPAATIKQANRMTNDVVVLGRKMVIPPQ